MLIRREDFVNTETFEAYLNQDLARGDEHRYFRFVENTLCVYVQHFSSMSIADYINALCRGDINPAPLKTWAEKDKFLKRLVGTLYNK